MIVLKFGGTSVSSISNVRNIAQILKSRKSPYIVVVSAFSGVTNLLEKIGNDALSGRYAATLSEIKSIHHEKINAYNISTPSQIDEYLDKIDAICRSIATLQDLSDKTIATLTSFGELMSSQILHRHLVYNGIDIHYQDTRNWIKTHHDHLNARVDYKTTNEFINDQYSGKNIICGGFIASNMQNETVTLGRGGSDYSATIIGAALKADRVEIWSDVSGFLTSNPNMVTQTLPIQSMSYKEAFELAYFGAKVLYPPAILPLMQNDIPLHLKNTQAPDDHGTLVNNDNKNINDSITGVSSISNIAMLTLSGVGLAESIGSARRFFQSLERVAVNIVLIVQNCSEQSIGIGISADDIEKAVNSIHEEFEKEILQGLVNEVEVQRDLCIIAAVGDQMKNRSGLSGKLFSSLGENGINILAISQGASERNISLVIDHRDERKALNVIHERFFHDSIKTVHLFIAGIGNVGEKFIEILQSRKAAILKEHKINYKIIGIANSKKMLVDMAGLENISASALQNGKEYQSIEEYLDYIGAGNLRNVVFIDNTASKQISDSYSKFLDHHVNIATCNKIACSSSYENYQRLMKSAYNNNVAFKYETCVGAALPIIKSIRDLIDSGDKITKIEAVISGSLNYIFNTYDGTIPFYQVVQQAQELGYTEPQPMIDLSGLDVMRKIIILAREIGFKKELSDINFEQFLPSSCNEIEDNQILYHQLKEEELYFKTLYEGAHKYDKKLKVVAIIDGDQLSVELKAIDKESPLYILEGKDNVVAINSVRYPDEPLVIKGAGAGALITASGVFSDVMHIVN